MRPISELENAFEEVGRRSKYIKLTELRMTDEFLVKEFKKENTNFGLRVLAVVVTPTCSFPRQITLPETYLSYPAEYWQDLQTLIDNKERYQVWLRPSSLGQKSTKFAITIKDLDEEQRAKKRKLEVISEDETIF